MLPSYPGVAVEDTVRVEFRLFQRAVPAGKIDVHFANFDAMVARVTHELGRRVKTHRLGVEDRRAEDVGIKGLEPAGSIDEQGEGGSVAFRKAILAKTFDLGEAALGEVARVVAGDHSVDEFLLQGADGSRALERRHGAAKFVRLRG